MTQIEAARFLGVSRRTVSRLLESGALPTVDLGKRQIRRVRRADVYALAGMEFVCGCGAHPNHAEAGSDA